MEINRRSFIAGLFGAFAFPSNISWANESDCFLSCNDLYVSARKSRDGLYSASVFSLSQGDIANVALPARGHDSAVHPFKKEVIIFARRPGTFAVALAYDGGHQPQWFYATPNRHFYGHGVFSGDGTLLYSTENDFENGIGKIGIRDATNAYQYLGEFSSYGVGPHDMALLSDGKTLVVANGGTQTHPETGRQVLNLTTMEPSLCYINALNGDLLERHVLKKELHQLSIRHLTVAKDDTVVFGCQYKGPKIDLPTLVGFHRRSTNLTFIDTPKHSLQAMKSYVGSVTSDQSGTLIAASCPKGDVVTFWDLSAKIYLGSKKIQDCCGLARTAKNAKFLITSGSGKVLEGNENSITDRTNGSHYLWDNHAVHIG
ncbi:MAG: DUF1513 domain-containing protein [Pseudomonadota bacterium]